MSVDKTEIFATGGFIFSLVFALLVASGLVGCNPGCGIGSGSCIGIDDPQDPLPPTCAEQVTDECVPEVIAEFCPEAEVVTVIEYVEVEVVVEVVVEVEVEGECPDVVEVECDLTVPVGHRPIECRGKGHASNTCKTTCIPWPGGGGTDCTTVCDDMRLAQNVDPIGCDPDFPCPIEAA